MFVASRGATELKHQTILNVSIASIIRRTQAVVPEQPIERIATLYQLAVLLSLPQLYSVKAIIDVSREQITISNRSLGEKRLTLDLPGGIASVLKKVITPESESDLDDTSSSSGYNSSSEETDPEELPNIIQLGIRRARFPINPVIADLLQARANKQVPRSFTTKLKCYDSGQDKADILPSFIEDKEKDFQQVPEPTINRPYTPRIYRLQVGRSQLRLIIDLYEQSSPARRYP